MAKGISRRWKCRWDASKLHSDGRNFVQKSTVSKNKKTKTSWRLQTGQMLKDLKLEFLWQLYEFYPIFEDYKQDETKNAFRNLSASCLASRRTIIADTKAIYKMVDGYNSSCRDPTCALHVVLSLTPKRYKKRKTGRQPWEVCFARVGIPG